MPGYFTTPPRCISRRSATYLLECRWQSSVPARCIFFEATTDSLGEATPAIKIQQQQKRKNKNKTYRRAVINNTCAPSSIHSLFILQIPRLQKRGGPEANWLHERLWLCSITTFFLCCLQDSNFVSQKQVANLIGVSCCHSEDLDSACGIFECGLFLPFVFMCMYIQRFRNM